ncbi:MAG: hypothetical protein AB2604_01530 [Candidatus Thiodiazotropha taylori]
MMHTEEYFDEDIELELIEADFDESTDAENALDWIRGIGTVVSGVGSVVKSVRGNRPRPRRQPAYRAPSPSSGVTITPQLLRELVTTLRQLVRVLGSARFNRKNLEAIDQLEAVLEEREGDEEEAVAAIIPILVQLLPVIIPLLTKLLLPLLTKGLPQLLGSLSTKKGRSGESYDMDIEELVVAMAQGLVAETEDYDAEDFNIPDYEIDEESAWQWQDEPEESKHAYMQSGDSSDYRDDAEFDDDDDSDESEGFIDEVDTESYDQVESLENSEQLEMESESISGENKDQKVNRENYEDVDAWLESEWPAEL